MANELQNKSPADTYKDVLQLGTATSSTPATGLPADTTQIVYDGAGVETKLKLGQSRIDADNIFITNGTITSLATPLTIAQGGTGGTSAGIVEVLWGIDKLDNIKLTTWDGGTDETGAAVTPPIIKLGTVTTGVWDASAIAVAKGGTGGTDITTVKTSWNINNVENIALSTWAGTSNITNVGTITVGNWNASPVPIANGGTGASTASAALTALGVGSVGEQDSGAVSITGGTLTNITLSNPTISALTDLTAGDLVLSSASITNISPANFITIPLIINTKLDTDKIDVEVISVVRSGTSTPGDGTLLISQYASQTETLLDITNSDLVSTHKVNSTGSLKGTQLGSSEDYLSFRNASESVNFGSTSQYSVAAGSLNTVESHDSKFTSGNVVVGDVIRIKQALADPWEVREIKEITSDSILVLTSNLTSIYTNTIYLDRISSAATEKMAVKNNGTVDINGGAWNSGHLVLGAWHLWVDSTGDLRMNSGAPTSDTDGTVVGAQS
jgi:hypothetical protein